MKYTVENYCGLIMRSRLLSPEAVQHLCQQWRQTAADPRDTRAFARWLVDQSHLTEYQAALLLHGYADNFFLGPYKILERIGKGRMAGVYRALHGESGQVVALKVLPPSSAQDATLLARFLREVSLARELVHPNIVRTFDAGQHNGLYYLVMEYLDGATLEEILKLRHTLSPLETARIGFFVCLALQYLHERHIVHRDVKPGNIMLIPAPQPQESTLSCVVKVLDVGLAREIFEPGRAPQHPDLTSESAILGSFDYLAPEQARDARRVDIRADLYSLGCVLYHCLAGQPPFPDSNPVRQLARHSTEQPRPLQEINSQVSATFWQVIARLLAKNPEERFGTPAEVAEALKTVLKEPPAAPNGETTRQMQAYLAWLQQRSTAAASPVVPATNLPQSQPLPSLKELKRRRRSKSRVIPVHPRKDKAPVDEARKRSPNAPVAEAAAVPPAANIPASPVAAVAPAAVPSPRPPEYPAPGVSSPMATPGSVAPGPPVAALPPKSGSSPDATTTGPSLPSSAIVSWINVEPVSAADLLKAPFGLPIPRDLFMVLLGALSVLFLVALIWLIVWLAGPS
ncbi:Serine/threonine-protein kinase PknB [bacterium HR36]|nr:Serine/threonine-protein kinase PknB [bacterium HR36]